MPFNLKALRGKGASVNKVGSLNYAVRTRTLKKINMMSHEITAACKLSQVDTLEGDIQTHLLKGQAHNYWNVCFLKKQFY